MGHQAEVTLGLKDVYLRSFPPPAIALQSVPEFIMLQACSKLMYLAAVKSTMRPECMYRSKGVPASPEAEQDRRRRLPKLACRKTLQMRLKMCNVDE